MDRTQNNKHNTFVNRNGAIHSRKRCKRLSALVNTASFAGVKRLLSNTKPMTGVIRSPPN